VFHVEHRKRWKQDDVPRGTSRVRAAAQQAASRNEPALAGEGSFDGGTIASHATPGIRGCRKVLRNLKVSRDDIVVRDRRISNLTTSDDQGTKTQTLHALLRTKLPSVFHVNQFGT
jgi:hypothetical protein